MVNLFGITNCDSCKKALKWLKQHEITFQFHDVKTQEIDPNTITKWLSQVDKNTLINRRSTTYRQLDDDLKQSIIQFINNTGSNESLPEALSSMARLLCQNPLLIKRPIIEYQEQYLAGFNADKYHLLLKGCTDG